MAAPTELGECLQRVGPGPERALRPLTAHGQHRLKIRLDTELDEEAAQMIGDRARRPVRMPVEPGLTEPRRLDTGRLGHSVVEALRLVQVPRDQRLPEIEDDCAVLHFLSSFFTEPQGRVFRI